MTDTRKVQLASEVDSTGARKGFGEIAQAGKDMAQSVGKSGQDAAKGVDAIGAGSEKSAAKLERAEKSIIGSIERTTAAMKAGERGTSSYFEALARQRGVSVDALKPYLDGLRQAEAAQRAAGVSLDGMGMSAKATAAAMRGVPAQFTDIITSLQGGQRPMTVFLQQGGQLKDMFGGAGNAAKALGGYVLGLVNPFTVAAAAAAGLAVVYNMGANEAQAFAKGVILSGQAAGVSVAQLTDMAAAIRTMGAGSQGRASEVLLEMASSANIGAQNMQRFAAAALNLERVGGPAAEETAKAFAALARDPLAASVKLNESTNFLTASLYQQIKALEDQGRTVDAGRLAQEAYSTAIIDATPKIAASLGTVESAWAKIKAATKGALDAALDVGRATGPAQRIAELEQEIKALRPGSYSAAVRGPELQAELVATQQILRDEAQRAAMGAERAASTKAEIEWNKAIEKSLSKQAALAAELVRIVNSGVAAGKTPQEIQRQIYAAQERAAEKPAAQAKAIVDPLNVEALKSYAKAMDEFGAIASGASAKSEGLSKTQAKLRDIMSDPVWQRYNRQQREQIIYEASLAQAQEDSAVAAAAAASEHAKWVAEIERSADAQDKQLQTARDEEEAYRIASEGVYSLKQAVEALTIARLQERQAVLMSYGENQAAAAIQREIDARRELIGLIGSREARDANEKAAKEAAREWEKITDQIGQSLTDQIMAGGKSGADYLRNLFRTLVLRPVVQVGVDSITGLITGNSSGGGSAGIVGQLSNLYSQGSALYKGYGALASYLGMTSVAGSGLAAGTATSATLGGLSGYGTAYGSIGSTVGGYGSLSGLGTSYGSIGGTLGSGASATGGATAGAGGASSLAASIPYVAAIVAGAMATESAYAKGYTVGNANTAWLEANPTFWTTRALSSLGLSDHLANVLGGGTVTSMLFGRAAPRVDAQGIAGTARAGDFSGNAFRDMTAKGGWFRSDKSWTETVALTDTLSTYMDAAVGSVYSQTKAFGEALGLPAAKLADITSKLRIQLGSDETKNKEAIVAALSGYTDDLVKAFADQLAPLRAYGETTAATLERVGTALSDVNDILGMLGHSALAASLDGGKAAVAIEALFGSADAFNSAATSYLQAFYTEAERAAITSKSLKDQLAAYGINTLPTSRAGYRALVDAQDLTTESGRAAYAALLKLAGAFDAVQTSADATAAALVESFKTAGNAVQDEINRLRGVTTGADKASLLASFATSTAAARAGDAGALAALPDISKSLEDAAASTATSALDIARMRAWLAQSLQTTLGTVPGFSAGGSFGGGVALVGEKGPELVSMGPSRIFNTADTSRMLGGDTSRLEAQIEALTAQVATLTEAARATAMHTHSTAKMLQRVAPDGDAIATRAAEA